MSKEFERLQPFLDKSYAYRTALTLLNFDNSTIAPKGAIEFTSKAIGILALENYNTLINPEVKEILDDFFGKLRASLVPIVHAVKEKSDFISIDFLRKTYDIEVQKKLSRFMAEYIGFDFNRGVMAETAHPYTTNLHNHDVRITNLANVCQGLL